LIKKTMCFVDHKMKNKNKYDTICTGSKSNIIKGERGIFDIPSTQYMIAHFH